MRRFRYVSLADMEAITEGVLSEFGFDPDAKRLRPVPVEEIAEFHFDLQLCWEPLDGLAEAEVVMAAIFPDRRQIVFNETQRELFDAKIGTYHFTLAHELGHWVLHTDGVSRLRERARGSSAAVMRESVAGSGGIAAFADNMIFTRRAALPEPVFYCRAPASRPVEEVQADLFAGCLLMPAPMMRRAVRQMRMGGSIRLSALYRLADFLQVSISALGVRLKQLGLLEIAADGEVRQAGAREERRAFAAEQLLLDL